jgi:hypothetical protein
MVSYKQMLVDQPEISNNSLTIKNFIYNIFNIKYVLFTRDVLRLNAINRFLDAIQAIHDLKNE